MNEKLIEYKFDELYTMTSGISSSKEQAGHGFPFVSFKNIYDNVILPENLTELMDTSDDERIKCSVKKGDVFLTRTSETLDELAISSVAIKDYPNATFSGFAKRLRPIKENVVYDKFMAFFLRSEYFRKIINTKAVMTLRASFNEKIFSYIKFYIPQYPVQVPIGNLFYDIEVKIRNNNKIISTLESMAKTIYDYWFLQFEFPNEEGKPYKSSGGKMVWNEELKREIPEGWSYGEFGDLISELECGDRPNGGVGNITEGIPSIGAENIIGIGKYDFSKEKYVPKDYFASMKSGIVKSWDVLMYKDGAGMGQASMVGDGFPHEYCAINSHVFILRSKDNLYQDYLYLTLCQEHIKKIIISLAAKAAQPGLNQPAVKSIKVVIPPEAILKKFNAKCNIFFHKIFACSKENKELTSLRDFLLPLLMNGQVGFKEQ